MNKPGEKWTIESMKRIAESNYNELMKFSNKAKENKFTNDDYYRVRELLDENYNVQLVLIEEIGRLR